MPQSQKLYMNPDSQAVYSLHGIRLDKSVVGQPCNLVMSDGRIRKVMRRIDL